MTLPCFKAYDIRGRIPTEMNTDIAVAAALGVAKITKASTLAVGHDVRATSAGFHEAVCTALMDAGYNILNVGQCGTEEVYHATIHFKTDAGIMITGSHNPIDQNGMKFIRQDGCAFTAEEDMPALHTFVEENLEKPHPVANQKGVWITTEETPRNAYIKHLLTYIDASNLTPLTVVVNAGNGCAGPVLDALEPHLPFKFIKVHHDPDGTFPHGIPNPLLVESRQSTLDTLKEHNADLAIAWDGDFDRCLLFDETGAFVSGYYMTGLLADLLLKTSDTPEKETIVHDARLVWNTKDIVQNHKASTLTCKAGHGHFRKKMREENSLFGGENSGHYFFQRFGYCDSGMVPWLLILSHLCKTNQKLSDVVNDRKQAFPATEETNRTLGQDASKVLLDIEKHFEGEALSFDKMDGLTATFETWRFNLRRSSNEPELVRLNVEAKNAETLRTKEAEMIALLDTF